LRGDSGRGGELELPRKRSVTGIRRSKEKETGVRGGSAPKERNLRTEISREVETQTVGIRPVQDAVPGKLRHQKG